MEIIVRKRQVLDNEEVFNCEDTYESIEDLEDAVKEITDNWTDMQGCDAVISCPKHLKIGSKFVLSCRTNNDTETLEITDIILAKYAR